MKILTPDVVIVLIIVMKILVSYSVLMSSLPSDTYVVGVGPLLDDRLKENLQNPDTLKGCPLYSLSCLSVCLSVTELQSTPFGLGT